MENNITTKDVEHLYLNCPCLWKTRESGIWQNGFITYSLLSRLTMKNGDMRLVLYPKTSITEAHMKELIMLPYKDDIRDASADVQIQFAQANIDPADLFKGVGIRFKMTCSKWRTPLQDCFSMYRYTPAQMLWLLAHGYDIFDLIPNGLAENAYTFKEADYA